MTLNAVFCPGWLMQLKRQYQKKEAAEQQKQQDQFFIEAIRAPCRSEKITATPETCSAVSPSDRLNGSLCKDYHGRFNLELSDLSRGCFV